MGNKLSKVVPFLVSLGLFAILVIGVHEMWHFAVAQWMGVPGVVTFNGFFDGFFQYLAPVTPLQDVIIGLAGGFGTATVFGILWLMNHWQGHYYEAALDEAFIFGAITIFQVIYGISEGIEIWMPAAKEWSQLFGTILAFTVPLLIYSRRLMAWWQNDV